MDESRLRRAGRRSWAGALVGILLAMAGIMSASPAWADGGGETTEGYQLVQQALGHLAHDTSDYGMSLAMEKIDDALATPDQQGVDVDGLKQAQAALEAGQVDEARALLQRSITEAVGKLKPATGEETGTTLVLSPLQGRASLTGRDWGFLVASALFLVLGAMLATRYRPHDNVRALRRRLGPPSPRPGQHRPATTKEQ